MVVHHRLMLIGIIAVVLTGCGSGELRLINAQGVVKFNGKPVPKATVTFVSTSGPPAVGTTDEEGRFQLNTLGRSGAAVGEYTISVSAFEDTREITPQEAMTMKTEELDQIRKSLVPAIYSHPRTSGLVATVTTKASENNFDLELTGSL